MTKYALIALSLGMGANQGLLAVVTYSLPGLVMDLFRMIFTHRNKLFFVIACASANMVSALLSNILVFQMRGIAFLLWMLVAGAAGLLAGLLGEKLFRRLIRVPENRDVMRKRIS